MRLLNLFAVLALSAMLAAGAARADVATATAPGAAEAPAAPDAPPPPNTPNAPDRPNAPDARNSPEPSPRRWAIVIAARGADGPESETVADYAARTARTLAEAGFDDERIAVFAESPAEGQREVRRDEVLAHLQRLERLTWAGDEVWVFLFGHANANSRGVSIATHGPRLRGEELAAALERVPGQQVVLCLNRQGAALLPALVSPRRVVVSATNSAQQLNPPLLPGFLLDAWERDPEATLLSALREANEATRQDYTARGLSFAEEPMALDGRRPLVPPFDDADDTRLAELRLKQVEEEEVNHRDTEAGGVEGDMNSGGAASRPAD